MPSTATIDDLLFNSDMFLKLSESHRSITDLDVLIDSYFAAFKFEIIDSRAICLVDAVSSPNSEPWFNSCALIFDEVGEVAWKIDNWGMPKPPSWWTILQQGFIGASELPSVKITQLPPIPGGPEPPVPGYIHEMRYRFALGLQPSSEFIVSCNAISFILGMRHAPNGPDDRLTFQTTVEWISRWTM